MKLHIIGHDASISHTAMHSVTSLNPDGSPAAHFGTAIRPKELKLYKDPLERLGWVRQQWRQYLDAREDGHYPGILCTEGYAMGAKFQREALGELGGMMRLEAYERGWTILVCAPNTLKKFVTGTGKGDKDTMRMEVLDRWKYKSTDNNDADAYALMRLGVSYWLHHYGSTPAKKADQETFKKLTIWSPA